MTDLQKLQDAFVTRLLQTGTPAKLVSRNLEIVNSIAEFGDTISSVVAYDDQSQEIRMVWIYKLKKNKVTEQQSEKRLLIVLANTSQLIEGVFHRGKGSICRLGRGVYGDVSAFDVQTVFCWLHLDTIKDK